jgi:hypothetical protein
MSTLRHCRTYLSRTFSDRPATNVFSGNLATIAETAESGGHRRLTDFEPEAEERRR